MALPTVSWSEATPSDDNDRLEGEQRIREFKTQVRELIAFEHQMDYVAGTSTQDTDWGWHNTLTLVAQSSNPARTADSVILYTKTISSIAEAFYIDEDGNSQQLTSNGNWIGGFTGEIRMWAGALASIPTGWALCDGNSGRPNLIAKFVRGINTSTTKAGTPGGADNQTLVEANLPSHTHTYSFTTAAGAHTHSRGIFSNSWLTSGNAGSGGYCFDSVNVGSVNTGSIGAHTHSVSFSTSFTGSTFNNIPAYYELAYIVKT